MTRPFFMLLSALLLLQIKTGEWPCYGDSPGGGRYSELREIDRANVAKLAPVWTYRTGDLSDGKNKPFSNFESTPIMVGDTLFLSTPFSRVIALDPDTGHQRWAYDPQIEKSRPIAQEPFVSRGVSTWLDPKTGKRRVYIATYDARLIALDAADGKEIPGFGKGGVVDLKEGLGKIDPSEYTMTSPPAVVNGLIVVGSSITDNRRVDAPSGVVRAYDARTGAKKWTWDPLSRAVPDSTDPNKPYLPGAGNVWSIISADPARDMVFVPTGSPSPDFYGGNRLGNDGDSNSVVALRASTGERLWGFQVVHHDLWDYDVPAQPLLADIAKDGRRIPAVVVMTKMGFVFVLDRTTGKPLLPVEERPVAQTDIEGERTSPTQPFPILPKPLSPDRLSPDEAWGFNADSRAFVKRKLDGLRMEGTFTPPSLSGTLIYPGNLGGCNWSGGSFDPSANLLFVNTNRLATTVRLVRQEDLNAELQKHPGADVGRQIGAPYAVLRETLYGRSLLPGGPPPWGTLDAIDLGSGERKWEVPLGVLPALSDLPGSDKWGSPNLGGSFVTATGLVFIAAAADPSLRAFDEQNGAVLWRGDLPASGQAAPMTYRSPKTGRQYVVQCAGGHHGLGTLEGDYVVAFALPK